MAKEGLKDEGARQELVKELAELTAANYKKSGKPKDDAVPQELKRIDELEAALAGKMPELPTSPPRGETDTAKLKRLEAENIKLKADKARGREAAKIKSQQKTQVGHVPRPDEVMAEALADAEDRQPSDWDGSNRLAVERTIRRFVRKGGSRKDHKNDWYELPAGFKKGITTAEKEYALKLLEKMDRLKGSAADILKLITDRDKKLTISQRRQTGKEFNAELEALGVSWDDSIQVPGMSATAEKM